MGREQLADERLGEQPHVVDVVVHVAQGLGRAGDVGTDGDDRGAALAVQSSSCGSQRDPPSRSIR